MNLTTEHWNEVSEPTQNDYAMNTTTESTDAYTPLSTPGQFHYVTLMIWTVVPPLIISLGTIGNGLTILIILRQKAKLTSTSLYLFSLALSDLLLLYTSPLRLWILHYWNIDVRNFSEISCKIHSYLTYVSVHLSSWLLVAVTLERVFSVLIPHRVKSRCTPATAGIIITATTIIVLVLNSHFLYGMGRAFVVEANGFEECYPKYKDYRYFFNSALPWVDLCVAFVFPFIVLTSGNVVIVVKLALNRRRRRYMSRSTGSQQRLISRDMSLTFLLLCLCVFFFLCLAPVSVFFIGFPSWRDEIIPRLNQPDARHEMEYLLFWHAVVNTVGYLNATCNFFFYVLSGSKFRREILSLICCRDMATQSVF